MKNQMIRTLSTLSAIVSSALLSNAQTGGTAVKSAGDMVKEAKQQIENLTPAQVNEEISKGDVTIIDLREADELKQNGEIPGAVHAPRGMLEFYADPSMPYYKPEFNKNKRIILHCASGGRSALAASTLKQMGYQNVAHMDGGFKAWKEAGMPVKK
jgi:rhodanese-related sulfurtransferase